MKTKLNLWMSGSLLSALVLAGFTPYGAAQEATAPSASPPAAEQAPPSTTSGAAGTVADSGIAPGPLEDARKILLARINQAKGEGIGTSAYMAAFQGIEDQVRAGQSAEQIKPRIESLARALKDQLDKSKILKTQRPIPPTASQAPGGAGASAHGGNDAIKAAISRATGGKGPSDETIDRLKERFGGGGGIPDGLKEKLLHDDRAREIIKKLGL